MRTIYNFIMQIAHGSFGEIVYVDATGRERYGTLVCTRKKPPPAEFILRMKAGTCHNFILRISWKYKTQLIFRAVENLRKLAPSRARIDGGSIGRSTD
jgi:hypothetical protein